MIREFKTLNSYYKKSARIVKNNLEFDNGILAVTKSEEVWLKCYEKLGVVI